MSKRISTKQKLLTILKKEPDVTMQVIAAHFSISEIAIRKHLHELEQQGFAKKKTIKQKLGRPYHTYALTAQGHKTFPNQYENLPLELLQDLEELHGEPAVKALLNKRMERECSNYQTQLNTEDFDEKMEKLAQIQQEKGYMVEIEKIDDGHYEMTHYNCPIANIANAYKQLCTNERTIYNNILGGSEVVLHSSITGGAKSCKWTIRKR